MARIEICIFCGGEIPPSLVECPDCGKPGSYPNVRAAEDPEERDALAERYRLAKENAVSRGCDSAFCNFEASVSGSNAVLARSRLDAERLATSTKELYATYYARVDAGIRVPDGDEWDIWRRMTDDALFPGYKEQISFAALSLDGVGLSHYGHCHMVLKEKMIANRATVFDENSVIFMRPITVQRAVILPKGYRASWSDRGKLATVKMAHELRPDMPPQVFQELLIKDGDIPEKDRFVEVHIWGKMSIRCFERVVMREPKRRRKAARATNKAFEERLGKHGVRLEWIP